MLSRAGLNRWCAGATPVLLLASNLPDADIVTAMGGALTYLDHHRGLSHGLAAAPVVAAAAVALVRLARPLPLLRALVVALIGVLLHLVLDWTNNYGIRMYAPFSEEWLRLDIAYVVDVWVWGILFLSLAAPFLSRLVSAEIGGKPSAGRGAAIFALTALAAFYGARYVLHERAVNVLNSYLYEDGPPQRVGAFAHFANPLVWRTVVEGKNSVTVQRMNLLFPYDPAGGVKYYRPENTPALEAARKSGSFQGLLRFSQFPLWTVVPSDAFEGAVQVQLMDLRFGDPSDPRFVATAIVDSAGNVREHSFRYGRFRLR